MNSHLIEKYTKFSWIWTGYGKYDYPTSGERNGQSFLCISLKTNETAEKVANQVNLGISSLNFY